MFVDQEFPGRKNSSSSACAVPKNVAIPSNSVIFMGSQTSEAESGRRFIWLERLKSNTPQNMKRRCS